MLYTIGHSNHTLETFIEILQAHKITTLVDVRTMPRSRHVPWFNKDKLRMSLRKVNINYMHMPKLGGLRHSTPDSINLAWRNKSFRGYADYMQTPEFFTSLKALNVLIKKKR